MSLDRLIRKFMRNVEVYKMFEPEDRVLVGLSGGKDSCALLSLIVKNLPDVVVEAVHIDLGYGECSSLSRAMALRQAEKYGVRLYVVKASKLGVDVVELARKSGRPICATCGVVKRYLLNLAAKKLRTTKIATGHILEDMLRFIVANAIGGAKEYLAKLKPYQPPIGDASAKVKPLFNFYSLETKEYCVKKGLRFLGLEEVSCPYKPSKREYATNKIVEALELFGRGSAMRFVEGVLGSIPITESPIVRSCLNCGMPTFRDYCAFCSVYRKCRGVFPNVEAISSELLDLDV